MGLLERVMLGVLVVMVVSLEFGSAGDIVHHDNIAPRRPGCDNNFVLVRNPKFYILSFYFIMYLLLLNFLVWISDFQLGKRERKNFVPFFFFWNWENNKGKLVEINISFCVVAEENEGEGCYWDLFYYFIYLFLSLLLFWVLKLNA